MSSTETVRGAGGALFAGVLLVVAGLLQSFQGLAAVMKGSFFVTPQDYFIVTSVSTWGWIHMGIGMLVMITGLAVLSGAGWARVVGIILACASIVSNFLYIPYYPLWSIVVIAIGLWVIHSLAVYKPREVY